MHQKAIQRIAEEVCNKAGDRFLGKILQLSPVSFALDVGLRGVFLFISAEPSSPRFYLIQRRMKELEKQSIPLSNFGQQLRHQLGTGRIVGCGKDRAERIVRLTLRVEDDFGRVHFRRLVAQLTGRAANLFILDELDRVVAALRSPKGAGQNLGEHYLPPPHPETATREEPFAISDSPSTAADSYFQNLDEAKAFDLRVNQVRSRLRQTTNQKTKLRSNLLKDLETHGDPETHKKIGDLLLANIATAVRDGQTVRITDFYSADAPVIGVEVDENISLQDAAAQRFRQYTKAKRAKEEISQRLKRLEEEILGLEQREQQLEQIAQERNLDALENFDQVSKTAAPRRNQQKRVQQIPGVRRYLSTDGYEILVGRGARDNDNLTFRIARPHDLWLHAGDYPGSHVVVRNPTRKEIPQRTVIEAAQLAGRFSQASDDAKVVIHYTERKFLSKPKGAVPGLVRLSSFRSITVEPKENIQRL
jgi:predicted ribosome quality control (RQC) complex YloA/Tae2 family protein